MISLGAEVLEACHPHGIGHKSKKTQTTKCVLWLGRMAESYACAYELCLYSAQVQNVKRKLRAWLKKSAAPTQRSEGNSTKDWAHREAQIFATTMASTFESRDNLSLGGLSSRVPA